MSCTMEKKTFGNGGCRSRRRSIDDDDSGDIGNSQRETQTFHDYFRELFKKKASVRQEAMSSILKTLTDNIEQDFVEQYFVVLVYQCLQCIKKGSVMEIQQAAHVIGLLAMITSCEDKAHEAYEDVLFAFSQGLKSKLKIPKVFECLAIVTFFGASNSEKTEEAMQSIWNFIHSEFDSNVHSPAILAAAISAWSFLLATVDRWMLSYKKWKGAISYFSDLLENNDETVCAAAGEALALIFEINCLEKFSTAAKDCQGSINEGVKSIKITSTKELKDNIIKQLRSQSAETGNDNVPTQEPRTGLNAILTALKFLEEDDRVNSYVTIAGQKLKLSTLSKMIQLKFLKHFLGKTGFVMHMMRNENFHNVFGTTFTPETNNPSGSTLYVPEREEVTIRLPRPPVLIHQDCSLLPFISREDKQLQKKCTMSPSSYLSKARTQLLKTQRRLSSEEREKDCLAVDDEFSWS